MSEWTEHRLGDIAEIVMGQSPSGDTCNNYAIGTPLLNGPTEFGNFHPIPTQFTTDPKRLSKIGDILFCVRGSTTGKMNWSDQIYAIGRGIGAIRHRQKVNCNPFIKAVIQHNLAILLQSATGSTFPNVSREQLNDLRIKAPDLPTQTAIAEILSSLDDKIELNNKINQELENLAQTLFTRWFVDFEFPNESGDPYKSSGGEMVESELGQIPKGWVVSTIDDITELVTKGTTPTTIGGRFTETGINFIKVESLSEYGAFIKSKFGYIDEQTNQLLKRSIIKEGDVLFTIAGTIGRVAVVSKDILPANTNQAVAILRPCDIDSNFLRLLMKSSLIQNETQANIVQAVQANISLGVIKSTKFIRPSKDVLGLFNSSLKHCFNRIELISLESEELTNLRDTLLPKLISGELEVS
jgi:type I restriction enzyme, S subunit